MLKQMLLIITAVIFTVGCNLTPSPPPTPTRMPTNTPAPTPTLITSASSPITYPTEVITPENAAAVTLLGFLPPPQQGEDELVGVSDFALLPVSDALDATDKIFVAHGFDDNKPGGGYPSLIKGIPIWDIATGKLEQIFGVTNTQPTNSSPPYSKPIYKLALSANGETLISSVVGQASVSLWHVPTERLIDRDFIRTNREVYNLAISSDGQLVTAVSIVEGGFSIYSIDQKWPSVGGGGHEQDAYGTRDTGIEMVFSPDGNKAASIGSDRKVYLWDIKEGWRIWKRAGDGERYGNRGLNFTYNGRLLAAADNKAIRIYDVVSGNIVHRMSHPDKYLTSLAFSPDDRLLVAGTRNMTHLGGPGKATLQIWEVETGKLLHLWPHPTDVTKVAFSHDGKLIISGGTDGVIRLWGLSPTD